MKTTNLTLIILILVTLYSCGHEIPIDKNKKITTPWKKTEVRAIEFNFSIEKLIETDNLKSRSTSGNETSNFKEGDKIGVFFADSVKNEPYTYRNGKWEGKAILLKPEQRGKIHIYFPYHENVSNNILKFSIIEQQDLCAATSDITYENPIFSAKLKHLLSKIRININKSEYKGNGNIEKIEVSELSELIEYDIKSSELDTRNKSSLLIDLKQNIQDNQQISCEFISAPMSKTDNIRVSVFIDGKKQVFGIPASHVWKKGYVTTYNINLKGDYNSPIDLPEYPIDVQYWSNYGKHENITIKAENRRQDSFSYELGGVQYGTTFYRNEGNIIKFSASWHSFEDDEAELYFKVIFLDNNNNIVEQFPSHKIFASEGVLKNLIRVAFVTAPAGVYRLGVLFRKSGWDYWVMAHKKSNCTDDDIKVRVAERGTAPAIRMMWADGNKSDANGIWKMPKSNSFNIDYILSNKGKTHLKGQIIAVWERTFKTLGNSFTLSDKREYSQKQTRNNDEWEDEIGRTNIDISPLTKFWKGRIKCSFPIKRNEPQFYHETEWSGFAAPSVHLYFQPEGSDKKTFLGIDGNEIMYDKDEEKSAYNIYKECNFIDIIPYEW